jgi:YidC/Oxa1 family membrane protein insertase
MKDENQRNVILAIVLSLIVLLGWQYFVVNPRVEQERLRQQAIQAQQQQQTTIPQPGAAPQPGGQPGAVPQPGAAPQPGQAGAPGTPAVPQAAATREAQLAASPRVAIDTPRLIGSINLRGGRIDDLTLRDYRVTVQPHSPNVVLFNPSGAREAFYAETGFVAQPGTSVATPNAQTVWTQEGAGALSPSNPVTLVWDNGQGLTFRRTYAVDANFMFTVREEIRNATGQPATLFPYALVSRHGHPPTAGMYILHEGLIGVLGEKGLREVTYSDIEKALTMTERARTGWLGITDKYWAAAVIPDQLAQAQMRFSANLGGPIRTYQADYLLDAQTVAPGASASVVHRVFAGAKEVRVVDAYNSAPAGPGYGAIDRFELLIDWGWFYFITKPLFWVLDYFYVMFGNFGVSILIVTLLIKLVFFPLANKSYESMAKMKKIQPEMLTIRERFAEDKMKQQQAMMELYKKEKINPLAGCLPILIQIPVFFALYKVLFVSIEMRHAPFFGWIKDLSAHDPTSIFNLFGLLPFAVPEMLQIGVWPLVMGVTMWVQMKMNPEPPDPVQKMIFGWMPVLFTFLLASFPAGLVIYWAWNNVLSVAQQAAIMRKNGVKIELMDNIRAMFKKAEKPAGG